MNKLLLTAAAMVTAVTIAACSSASSSSTSSPSSSGSSNSVIQIGAWTPLSGPIAPSGLQVAAGAKAAFAEVNAAGGINGHMINYTVLDNAYDPVQTIQAARTLIGQDHAVAIVASDGTAATAAAFPYVLQQSKVPILFTYGGAATWYNPPQDGLFGFEALYENQAKVLGAWAASSGAKNILVVHDDPAAFLNVANNVAPGATATNPAVKVSELSVKLSTTDYSPIVAQVKAQHPDAVVLILPVPEVAAYLKQAKLQGVSATTYGYAPDADPGLLTLAGTAAEGFRTLSLSKLPTDTSDPAVAAYLAALKKYQPSQAPGFYSMDTYAAARAFIQILKGIKGPITSASISQAVANAGTIDTGLLPPLTFSASQHLGTNQMMKVVVTNGAFATQGTWISPVG